MEHNAKMQYYTLKISENVWGCKGAFALSCSDRLIDKDIDVLFVHGAGVESSPLLLWPFIIQLYQPWMIDGEDCGAISRVNKWHRKWKSSEKICPSATLSASDPTWLDPESNPGCHGGKPATNHLSYSTAISHLLSFETTWTFFYIEILGNPELYYN
jgi:hypothetical protein